MRAPSACGQILHKNPGKGQTPPHSGNACILGVSGPATHHPYSENISTDIHTIHKMFLLATVRSAKAKCYLLRQAKLALTREARVGVPGQPNAAYLAGNAEVAHTHCPQPPSLPSSTLPQVPHFHTAVEQTAHRRAPTILGNFLPRFVLPATS